MNTKSSEKSFSRRNKNLLFTGMAVGIAAIGIILFQKFQDGARDKKTDVELLQEVVELTQKLEVESLRGTEYFNSPSYDTLLARGASNVGRLKARIREPNRKYLLTLLALRAVSKDSVYAQLDFTLKAGILIDALNQATYFNAWGLPHLYSVNTASRPAPVEAIIELGQPVVSSLRSLLSEKRSAPRWGSEEGFQNEKYKYRVADYALALICKIEGIEFPGNREGRDSLIQNILD